MLCYYDMLYSVASSHRVTIQRISKNKETYTVKRPRKILPTCDDFRGCLGMRGIVGVNGLGLILQNHSS
jgi:hypothetical protein